MSDVKHTPTPWRVLVDDADALSYANKAAVDEGFVRHAIVGGGTGEFVLATVINDVPDGEANARFIVRAVNSHAQLIEALEKWKAYDELLRSLPRVGPIYGGQLEHVDATYDDCAAATLAALAQARESTP